MQVYKKNLLGSQQYQEGNQKQGDKKRFISAIPIRKVVEQIGQFLPVCICGKGLVNLLFALLFPEQFFYFFFQGLSHFENGVVVTCCFLKDLSGEILTSGEVRLSILVFTKKEKENIKF